MFPPRKCWIIFFGFLDAEPLCPTVCGMFTDGSLVLFHLKDGRCIDRGTEDSSLALTDFFPCLGCPFDEMDAKIFFWSWARRYNTWLFRRTDFHFFALERSGSWDRKLCSAPRNLKGGRIWLVILGILIHTPDSLRTYRHSSKSPGGQMQGTYAEWK